MPIHRIRLAGPWESRTIDAHRQPTGESVRCQLPFTLSESQHELGIQLTRSFHHPTGVDDKTTLRIVLQTNESPFAVRVNSTKLVECAGSPDGEYAFDITGRIAAFNVLCVLLKPKDHDSAAALNTVWLEIHS